MLFLKKYHDLSRAFKSTIPGQTIIFMGFDFQGHNTFAAPKERKDSVIHPTMHVHVDVLLQIFHVGCGIIHTPRGVFES